MTTNITLNEVNYKIIHHRSYSGCKQTYEQPAEKAIDEIEYIWSVDTNTMLKDKIISDRIIIKLEEMYNQDFEY